MCEKNKNTKLLEIGGDMFQNLHQTLEIATHNSQYLPSNVLLSDCIIYYNP